jgi:hypothetical protein
VTVRIRSLPARYPELGRIRLGSKGPKGEPRKGKFLRFSSDDEVVLKALADQLGGEVMPWEDDKAEQAWHLTTESASIPILLPPDPIDTTYEKWGSGGIAKRCDGERCLMPMQSPDGGHMVERDCACLAEGLVPGDRDDQKEGACQVTVRLRLIIPSVPGLGAWLCTSHSIYAAMELPGQIELLQAMSGRGRLVPADFAIEPRTEKKPWEKYKRDYIVPVLRVRASLAQLASGEQVAGELTPGEPEPLIDCPVGCGHRAVRVALRDHLVDEHSWQRNAAGGVLPPGALSKAPGTEPTATPLADNGSHDESPVAGHNRSATPLASDTGAGEPQGAPVGPAPVPSMTTPQRGLLLATLGERGKGARQDRLDWAADTLGRHLESFDSLTKAEAHVLIEAAQKLPVTS